MLENGEALGCKGWRVEVGLLDPEGLLAEASYHEVNVHKLTCSRATFPQTTTPTCCLPVACNKI